MIQTILGVVVLFAPFILVFNFRDRVQGFLYVFTSILSIHVVAALSTQAFHIFSYGIILSIHTLIAVSCIIYFLYQKKYFSNIKFNWLALIVFAIVSFELLSVHYFYKGIISEAEGFNVVSRDFYVYPHYSDEWVGVSFADYSISHKSLPMTNPLWYDEPFANGLAVFYSFISELFLLLNLTPLVNWSLFATINGLLVSFLIYLLLRVNNISNFSGAIAAMSVPLIVNGTNLPGVWFLTPFIFALSIYIISLICFSKREFTVGIVVSLICLLLYPPFIVFVFPTLLVYILMSKISPYYLVSIGFVGFFIITLLSINLGFSKAFSLAYSWLIRANLDGGGIVSMHFWIILPILLVPFIIFGLVIIIKKKLYVLFTPVLIGIFFWILFSFVKEAIIIDQSRAVAVASILLMIPIGFGVEVIISLIKNRRIVNFVKVGFIFAFVITAAFYPGSNVWSKLVLKIETDEGTLKYSPTAPITRYLYPDDLRFFGIFYGKRFLSPPWKGLAIGVATHNYPLDSKDSTITNEILRYSDFMKGTCEEKNKKARDFKIDYIYSRSFECLYFEKLATSQEGFHLYRPIP